VARVGLLGGTFNPPHLAHLVCAQEALVALGLDRVLLVPVGVAPHKTVEADPGVAHRVAMCEAAVAGDGRLGVSRADADRAGPSYTVDLLRALRAEAVADELTFIVGGDMAYSLPAWREPEAVLALAELGVAEREGVRRADILKQLAGLAGATERVRFFDMPRIDISSSMIRRRAGAGLPVRYLVPDPVAAYIEREALYRAPREEPSTPAYPWVTADDRGRLPDATE
jgi:nicotinate-nucleotide adenylyltransferase